MPTDEEIAALLALPDGAREALKGCEGPGWRMPVDSMTPALFPTAGMARLDHGEDWLPCNPLEIVRVAAETAHPDCDFGIAAEKAELGQWTAYADDWSAYEPTPHLAALGLLAEVWR
jgi:hypothetical protein